MTEKPRTWTLPTEGLDSLAQRFKQRRVVDPAEVSEVIELEPVLDLLEGAVQDVNVDEYVADEWPNIALALFRSPTAKGIARKALEEGRQLRLDVNRREQAAPQIPRLPQDIFYMENERHRQSRP